MKNELLSKMREGKIVLGLNNMYPAAGIIEGMAKGWDFVWIDGQHGQHTYDTILQAVRTASLMQIDPVVRVPGHSTDFLGLVADMYPSGIMIPMVNTKQEARAVSASLHFPPLGMRSYGGRRVIDLDGRDYFQKQEILVLAQIETVVAGDAVDEIAETEGIDCLFFGPDDMKIQLGLPIDTTINKSKELLQAMRKLAKASQKAGKFAACPAPTIDELEVAVGLGYSLIVGGGDIGFLRTAAQQKLVELQNFLNHV